MAGNRTPISDRMLGYRVPPRLISRARSKWVQWRKRQTRPIQVEPTLAFFVRHWQGTIPQPDYIRRELPARSLIDPSRRTEYVTAFRLLFPQREAQILAVAQRALAGQFTIFGQRLNCSDQFPDWHTDFISGKAWPKLYGPQIQLVNFLDDSDIKVPWELSRMQWLSNLGRAYWLTNDERYAEHFFRTVEHWEAVNTVGVGVNWTCSMEVAIRAINIIWGLLFVGSSASATSERIASLVRLLYYHGRHIAENLEIIDKGANTNHLLSDYLGLWYLALLFPEFDRAAEWQKLAQQGLEEEIIMQVHSAGFDYEGSTAYHRLVSEIFLSAAVLGRRNGQEFSKQYLDRLWDMLEFSAEVASPSGRVPLIGDNDDGCIVELSENDPSNHQPLVELGRAFRSGRPVRPQFEECLWYLGPEACTHTSSEMPVPLPGLVSRSGISVYRRDGLYCLLSAIPVPKGTMGGHRHNDLLAVLLEVEGIPILIDAGTSCYTSEMPLREQARSVVMHNTIQIENSEQQRILSGRPFLLVRDAATTLDVTESESSVRLQGSHTGFARLPQKARHHRTVVIDRRTGQLKVQDRLEGKEGTVVSWVVRYLTPIATTKKLDQLSVEIEPGGNMAIRMTFDGAPGELRVNPTRWWPRYRQEKPAMHVEFLGESRLPFEVRTVIDISRCWSAASALAQPATLGTEEN